MRRRPPEEDASMTPLALRRFDSADWGGGPDAPQCWYDARTEWAEMTGEHPETDPDTAWPDVPFDPEAL